MTYFEYFVLFHLLQRYPELRIWDKDLAQQVSQCLTDELAVLWLALVDLLIHFLSGICMEGSLS